MVQQPGVLPLSCRTCPALRRRMRSRSAAGEMLRTVQHWPDRVIGLLDYQVFASKTTDAMVGHTAQT